MKVVAKAVALIVTVLVAIPVMAIDTDECDQKHASLGVTCTSSGGVYNSVVPCDGCDEILCSRWHLADQAKWSCSDQVFLACGSSNLDCYDRTFEEQCVPPHVAACSDAAQSYQGCQCEQNGTGGFNPLDPAGSPDGGPDCDIT